MITLTVLSPTYCCSIITDFKQPICSKNFIFGAHKRVQNVR